MSEPGMMARADSNTISDLRAQVSDLRESRGVLTANVETLTKTVDKLSDTVEKLTAALNQGRGALWAITIGAGAVGAIIPTFIGWLAHR